MLPFLLLACDSSPTIPADSACSSDGQDDSTSEAWSCPEPLPSDEAFDRYSPVVVCTVPRVGDAAVDPATDEIRVTFSKDMQAGSWSWVQTSDRTFPETTGDAYYATARTNVLPVSLEPDQTYQIWLNSDPYLNFQDEQGNSAVPFQLTFRTAGE